VHHYVVGLNARLPVVLLLFLTGCTAHVPLDVRTLSPAEMSPPSPARTPLATAPRSPSASPIPRPTVTASSASRLGEQDRWAFRDGRLVTSEFGWALLRDDVAVTTDGGRTWHATSYVGRPEHAVSAVEFASERVGWVLRRASPEEAEGGVLAHVERTENGGGSWSSAPLLVDASADAARPAGGTLAVVDSTDLYALVAYEVGRGRRTDEMSALFVSSDGGATWQSRSLPEFEYSARSVWFDSRLDGWVSDGAELYRTTDGARTWTPVELPKEHLPDRIHWGLAGLPRAYPGRGYLLTVAFHPGDGGAIFQSTDGAAWTLYARVPEANWGWLTVGADGRLFSLDWRSLSVSNEHGASWSTSSLELPGPIERVDFADDLHWSSVVQLRQCDDVLSDCLIPLGLFVTDDGGLTWRDATP
jgi:photosystem II stability/assembly factor-like uncharacterized protein